jgi:hypothetical protein
MLVRLAPGEERSGDDPAWSGAVVVVVCGRVELGADRVGFGGGAVLAVEGLAVRNPGPGEALLATYARAFSHSALCSFFAAR